MLHFEINFKRQLVLVQPRNSLGLAHIQGLCVTIIFGALFWGNSHLSLVCLDVMSQPASPSPGALNLSLRLLHTHKYLRFAPSRLKILHQNKHFSDLIFKPPLTTPQMKPHQELFVATAAVLYTVFFL